MTDPTTPDPTVLPRDKLRTVVAALITALTIGGWINALGRTPLRDALRAQTRLWWIEQVIAFALAVVCIGIILRKRSFLGVAFWLTIYSTLFDVMRWIFEFIDGEIKIPVALVLYLLFLWRLMIARRQLDSRWVVPSVESPPG